MIETLVSLGILTIIVPVMLYQANQISKLTTKVDLIYKNLNITIEFIKDNNNNRR